MILTIHMIDTGNIVGHIFGANFGKYTDTFMIRMRRMIHIILVVHMIDMVHDTYDTHDRYWQHSWSHFWGKF